MICFGVHDFLYARLGHDAVSVLTMPGTSQRLRLQPCPPLCIALSVFTGCQEHRGTSKSFLVATYVLTLAWETQDHMETSLPTAFIGIAIHGLEAGWGENEEHWGGSGQPSSSHVMDGGY